MNLPEATMQLINAAIDVTRRYDRADMPQTTELDELYKAIKVAETALHSPETMESV